MFKEMENEIQPTADRYDEVEVDDLDPGWDRKGKIECICPKCGRRHSMSFRWIGRGVPRKFCKSCRESDSMN